MRITFILILFCFSLFGQNNNCPLRDTKQDVVVLVGQSGTTGFIYSADVQSNQLVTRQYEISNHTLPQGYTNNTIEPYTPELNGSSRAIQGVLDPTGLPRWGLEMDFMDLLINDYSGDLHLMKIDAGGTSLNNYWLEGSSTETGWLRIVDGWSLLKSELKAQGRFPNIIAFIWFQGESDILDVNYATNYEANEFKFINDVRSLTSEYSAPWITLQVENTNPTNNSFQGLVQQGKINNANNIPNTYIFETRVPKYPKHDFIHIDGVPSGAQQLGKDLYTFSKSIGL